MMTMNIVERLLALEHRVEELERQELPVRNYSVPVWQVSSTTHATLRISGPQGATRDLVYATQGVSRWVIRTNSTTETGNTTGSNLEIISRNDDGSLREVVLFLRRLNGAIGVGLSNRNARLSIRPASDAIGTRSFEIRNHANSQDDLYVAVAASGVEGYIRSSGWLTASDERIKTNICATQRGLADILAIQPVEYSYRGEQNQKRRHGVTAQSLQQICPELVETLPDGTLAVRSTELIFILIRAVQELAEQVAALHAAAAAPPPPSDDPPHSGSPLDPAE